MRRFYSYSLFVFVFSLLSVPSLAFAKNKANRCGPSFLIFNQARVKQKVAAKRVARKKVQRRAKLRCRGGKLVYLTRWQYLCKRSKGLILCKARAKFRCCGAKFYKRKRQVVRRKRRKVRRKKRIVRRKKRKVRRKKRIVRRKRRKVRRKKRIVRRKKRKVRRKRRIVRRKRRKVRRKRRKVRRKRRIVRRKRRKVRRKKRIVRRKRRKVRRKSRVKRWNKFGRKKLKHRRRSRYRIAVVKSKSKSANRLMKVYRKGQRCRRARVVVKGYSREISKHKAMLEARGAARIRAMDRCGGLEPVFLKRWNYRCSKSGRRFVCSANSFVRCCRSK